MLRVLALLLLMVSSFGVVAKEYNKVIFHAQFGEKSGVLRATIPSALIDPELSKKYPELKSSYLTSDQRKAYLVRYLRDTVKLQYSAFPMALGDSRIVERHKYTEIIVKVAFLPRSASQLLVEITSFADNPDHTNVFTLNKEGLIEQKLELNSRNDFTGLLLVLEDDDQFAYRY